VLNIAVSAVMSPVIDALFADQAASQWPTIAMRTIRGGAASDAEMRKPNVATVRGGDEMRE
jgi:hypothetical protein